MSEQYIRYVNSYFLGQLAAGSAAGADEEAGYGFSKMVLLSFHLFAVVCVDRSSGWHSFHRAQAKRQAGTDKNRRAAQNVVESD